MSSKEAQLSARHVCHRTPSHFENIVKSNTWVLKNALASESSRPIRELHVRFARAYASYRLQEFAKALADFSHCIEIEPAWHLAYYNRGCTYYKLGRLDDAVKDVSKAIKYDPKNKVYIESRATLLRERGNFKEAIEDYNRIEALNLRGDECDAADDRDMLTFDAQQTTSRPATPTSTSPPKSPPQNAHINRRYSTIGRIVLTEDGLHPSLASLFHLPREERTRFDIVNALPIAKSWRFFQQQSESVMVAFLMAGNLESFAPRSHVFRQGDEADAFYILLTGSVAVSIEMFENGTIASKKVCTLLPGDGFGEPRDIQGPRRATVTALSKVHCLSVRHALYQDAMRDHMKTVYDDKCQILRQCRVFESCTTDVVERIAQLSSVLLFEPYRTILKAGELVDKLFVIKRGVCHVTKSLALDPVTKLPETKRPSTVAGLNKKKKSYDGSWVVDNGWQLTNPRLRNEFLDMEFICIEYLMGFAAEVLADAVSVCVLRPNQPSTINVTSSTMVEVLELTQEGLAQINLKFNSRTMNALQESFLFHNPPNPKIAQLYKEREMWQLDKAKIIRDTLNRGKQTGLVKRGVEKTASKQLEGLHHRSSFYNNHL